MFVMFSSIAGSVGGPGQASYAAANALLDAIAEQRQSQGLAALAIAWGSWSGGAGMAADAAVEERMRRIGAFGLAPERALAALGNALRQKDASLTVADIDWSLFAPGMTMMRPSRLLDELPEVRLALSAAQHTAAAEAGESLVDRLVAMPEPERAATLTKAVRSAAAAVLGHGSAEAIEPGQAFSELGFDSLTAVEFRNRLAKVTGLNLSQGIVFDYPTPAGLAKHLRAEILPEDTGDPVQVEFDRLEKALAGFNRATVAEHLQALLVRWEGSGGPEVVGEELLAASDDEMFDFIGREFGIS
jgi:acyl carrier protein